MPFKDISYLKLSALFLNSSVEWVHLFSFGSWHYEENLCEIILALNQWFRRRCHLRYFLSRALVAPLFG